jgi:tRNA wybutosine-synthesizing protein 2
MFVAVIPAQTAGQAIEEMLAGGLVDRTMKIQRSETEVFVPLAKMELPGELAEKFLIRIEEWDDRMRVIREPPYKEIGDALLERGLSISQVDQLPERWEMVGDVLILKLHEELLPRSRLIAEEYARVLKAKTVIRDKGSIQGVERIPEVEVLLGSVTETVHLENGILYSLDAAKIMFSSGNVGERTRMASIPCKGETIIDMFAGIGYLSLPMAVYGKPEMVYACEIRKLSYDYLVKNIALNNVNDRMTAVLGDNRDFVPPKKADRIIMGYLADTYTFLPKALENLKSGGIIHYHENFPNALLPGRPGERLKEAAGDDWKVEVMHQRIVKTFAPGVSHIAVDTRFTSS